MDELQNTQQAPLTKPKPKVVLGCKVQAEVYEKWQELATLRQIPPSQLLRGVIEREIASETNLR